MAWSYGGDLLGSKLDLYRFKIGDTDEHDPLLQDGEIEYLLATHESIDHAIIAGVEALVVQFAKQVDYRIGPEQVTASQRFEHYSKLLSKLEAGLRSSNAVPSGGTSLKRPPIFRLGMTDNASIN